MSPRVVRSIVLASALFVSSMLVLPFASTAAAATVHQAGAQATFLAVRTEPPAARIGWPPAPREYFVHAGNAVRVVMYVRFSNIQSSVTANVVMRVTHKGHLVFWAKGPFTITRAQQGVRWFYASYTTQNQGKYRVTARVTVGGQSHGGSTAFFVGK